MENEPKVFRSNITTRDYIQKNNLNDLLKREPPAPVPQPSQSIDINKWVFTPKYDTRHIPRKKSKLKVKTVKDIRAVYETDIYKYLVDDIERKQRHLLRKIKDGFSTEATTRTTASKLINGGDPISKSVLQMLIHINPERHKYPKQYVLWNNKYIQINGSRGGKTKCICNYDLYTLNTETKLENTSANFKKSFIKPRVALLRRSLNVNFKPGPLGKKKLLDDSHQKYQMGDIELVKLPKPVLEISPLHGTALEPAFARFVNDLRGETGVISEKFALFSVTALGTIKDHTLIQLNKGCSVIFDLHYKCNQSRIMMRKNVLETTTLSNVGRSHTVPSENVMFMSNEDIEIKKMLDEIIQSVDININQDCMYSANEYGINNNTEDVSTDVIVQVKDNNKRKYFELDKLDVTIIKLPENSEKVYYKPCGKSFCSLGCVCESLNCILNLKQHCGVADCMFGCKCEASYKDILMSERDFSDIIPGLLNLENKINSHLAKEEQKFHQTMIFSGEKSIVLNSQKRVFKSSKKYAEFYSDIHFKNYGKVKKVLTVNAIKLNCENIEPYCMVHNLYKCFCHGKFTETYNVTKSTTNVSNIGQTNVDNDINLNNCLKERKCDFAAMLSSSARTNVYKSRNYSEDDYRNTNKKILEMEKHDRSLKKKMLKLMNGINSKESKKSTLDSSNIKIKESTKDTLHSSILAKTLSNKKVAMDSEVSFKLANKNINMFLQAPNKIDLKVVLENSYRNYKKRLEKGIKITLRTPKIGRMDLYSWEFILRRYIERKNLFVVSKQKPYSTFLGNDDKHPRFANCININDLHISDIPNYPPSIRNLVSNTCHSEKTFCLLRGCGDCWEVIASVHILENTLENQPKTSAYDTADDSSSEKNDGLDWTHQRTSTSLDKNIYNHSFNNLVNTMSWQDYNESGVVEQETAQSNNIMSWQFDNVDSKIDVLEQDTCSDTSSKTLPWQYENMDNEIEVLEKDTNCSERSKWFVMAVENDFTNIVFYLRRFYVTFDGIKNCIDIARILGKTVRLSLQTRDKINNCQFGIYVIPSASKDCVFVGPYEIDEPLGIEIIKTFKHSLTSPNQTRGVWITTKNVNDVKVFERPLSFKPSAPTETIVAADSIAKCSPKSSSPVINLEEKPKAEEPKWKSKAFTPNTMKPIKVRRTNGFYHLTNNILNTAQTTLSINNKTSINQNSVIIKNPSKASSLKGNTFKASGDNATSNDKIPVAEIAPQVLHQKKSCASAVGIHIRPIAEIAPQSKIDQMFSQRVLQSKRASSRGGSMLILKPKEINERILKQTSAGDDVSMAMGIESFLESSAVVPEPAEPNTVYEISDAEDVELEVKNVWIQCSNIDNFGCIRGKQKNKLLSFEFPGFKYSEFYPQEEAFEKINQVIIRKMFKPNNLSLKWTVTEHRTESIFLTPELMRNNNYVCIK